MQSVNLTNHFLIAMPNMVDPYFAKSLTYICEHNEQGALGVVVNRPLRFEHRVLNNVQCSVIVTNRKGRLLERPALHLFKKIT